MIVMQTMLLAAELAGAITGIAACVCLLVKPLRNRILGLNDVREGQRCLLRSDILNVYYKYRELKQIRQYEYENVVLLYKAYKALGGNTFVDHIYNEINEWEVVS